MKHPKGVPYWGFSGDARAWRRSKRAEWRDVMRALKVFQCGSAYTPCLSTVDHGKLNDFTELAEEIERMLSPKQWGK